MSPDDSLEHASRLMEQSATEDYREGLALLEELAASGHVEAMARLGAVLDAQGDDLQGAVLWLSAAAAAGHAGALGDLALYYPEELESLRRP